jgi:membrane fusion protein, multidrug efflux system
MRELMRASITGVAAGLLLLTAAGCGQNGETAAAADPSAAAAVNAVLLAPENVVTAAVARISSGPTVSGQLTPAREATVRSQVGGSIVSLDVDRGQRVREGDVVARISSRDLDAALRSAEAAVQSAGTALATAKSEAQRTEALVKGGALAARDLEQARNLVSNTEAQVAAAKARLTSVTQQLDDTSVKAPFSGVVSERPASLGDVVSPGAPIVTIIDPSSLRLEASVASDEITRVRPGATVEFSVRGYPTQQFVGRVDRLSPTADPATRQVAMFVSLPNTGGKLIAGLFAEGRVVAETRSGIVVPLSAVDETGPVPVVTRIRDGKAERVVVGLGVRQAETERVEIRTGLEAGDVLITGSSKGVAPGTQVRVTGDAGRG